MRKEKLNYKLIANDGKVIIEETIVSDLTSIDMQNIANGVYFLKVTSDNQSEFKTFKIIKSK